MKNEENPFKLDVVSIRLVKDAPLCSGNRINTPESAVKLVGEHLCEMDREVVCVINLKTDGTPINCTFASIGSINESTIHPRELLKASILSNAAQMIILHNHPSGNLRPSQEDSRLTDRMVKLCNFIGIPLLDHIIVGGDNKKYFSFREKNIMPIINMELKTDYRAINFAETVRESEMQYDAIPENPKQRLFVDMDGTLTVFTPQDSIEPLYEKDYFLNLPPHENVVEAIKHIVANQPDIDVYVLSSYLTDSEYALTEKQAWVEKYLPEIDETHRIFVPNGSNKKEWIGGQRPDDILIDDYTENLLKWHPGKGIKLINAINHTRETWQGDRIRYDREPIDLADSIVKVIKGKEQIKDAKIRESGWEEMLHDAGNQDRIFQNIMNMVGQKQQEEQIPSQIQIPTVTVDPAVLFFEEERPEEFKLYHNQIEAAENAWKSIVEDPSFSAAEFTIPGKFERTLILTKSIRDGVDYQLTFLDKDKEPVMHEDYYIDKDDPSKIIGNAKQSLYSRLANFSHDGTEIFVSVEYDEKERENRMEKNVVKVQSAVISNYEGYNVFWQFDRNGSENIPHRVYLGKRENYDNHGNYDNTDNSLIFISDNDKMGSFLEGSGWVVSQQGMIENGTFTEEDYAEFSMLKETVLRQFKEIRPIRFEIDMEKREHYEESGMMFTFPDWKGKQQGNSIKEKTYMEKLEAREDYCFKAADAYADTNNSELYLIWMARFDEVRTAIEILQTEENPEQLFQNRKEYTLDLFNKNIESGFVHMAQEWQERHEEINMVLDVIEQEKEKNVTISFYVAEANEFHSLGEFHEGLTLKEAFDIYDQIPSDRLNAGKTIGFTMNLGDGSLYDGTEMDLVYGKEVQEDLINMIGFFRDNKEVQQAIADCKNEITLRYGEKREEKESVSYIHHFYVVEDLQKKGPLDIQTYDDLKAALRAYSSLPLNKVKALGIQNNNDLPGTLDFIQCKDGEHILIQDYKNVSELDNLEIQNVVKQIEEAVNQMQKDYDLAVQAYSAEQGVEIENDYVKAHSEELIYCYQNNKELIDFDYWTHCEDILGEKITYEEFTSINETIPYDLMEVEAIEQERTEDDIKAVNEIRSILHDIRNDLNNSRNEVQKNYHGEDGKIHENSENIHVEGHVGTWHVIGAEEQAVFVTGNAYVGMYYLLEHDTYGEDAAALIVTKDGKVAIEDVYNGFDDLGEQIDGFQDSLQTLEEAGYEIVSITDTFGCEVKDMNGNIYSFTNYDELIEAEGPLVEDIYNRVIQAMEAAGYALDIYESTSASPVYNYEMQTIPLRFESLKENMEWLNGVVFDDPEISDAVERIMHPNIEESERMEEKNKIRVAIESTDDYTEPGFYRDLADIDIQNPDGTYGRIVDQYRIVRIGENGRLKAFDERTFLSSDEAREAVSERSDLTLVSYDDLVNEAAKALMYMEQEITTQVDERVQYDESSFHEGDYYEDAHNRGIITHVYLGGYGGQHQPLFSYIDPQAKPGSRDARGYIMYMPEAIDRLNRGEAKLTPEAELDVKISKEQAQEQLSMFDQLETKNIQSEDKHEREDITDLSDAPQKLKDESIKNTEELARRDREGNPEYYRYFYDYDKADAFQAEKNWKMFFGSDYQGLNGGTYVVYREINDLPEHLRDYAKEQEEISLNQKAEDIYRDIIWTVVDQTIGMQEEYVRDAERASSYTRDYPLTDGQAERMWEHERDRGYTWDIGENEREYDRDGMFLREYNNYSNVKDAILLGLQKGVSETDIRYLLGYVMDGEIFANVEETEMFFNEAVDGVIKGNVLHYRESLKSLYDVDLEQARVDDPRDVAGYNLYLYQGELYLETTYQNGFSDITWLDGENRVRRAVVQDFELSEKRIAEEIKAFAESPDKENAAVILNLRDQHIEEIVTFAETFGVREIHEEITERGNGTEFGSERFRGYSLEELKDSLKIYEEGKFKYYSVSRPVGIGTYPVDGMLTFVNYNERTFVDTLGREAWGEIFYNRELSEKELSNYELMPVPEDKTIEIDGYKCRIVDEWENGTASYILGRDIEDEEFFFARVEEKDESLKGVYSYEYDERPVRNKVEDEHLNRISEIALDRHEAEFGADGSRNFPHLNDEPQEAVYFLDENQYLHIQVSDEGYDYTIYDKNLKLMDGGQFDNPELTITEVRDEILKLHEMHPNRIEELFIDDFEHMLSADEREKELNPGETKEFIYSENEAIVRLAERIDNFMYENDTYEYRDSVGTSLEERSEHRAEIAHWIENGEVEAIAKSIASVSEALWESEKKPEADMREANDILYSLAYLDQYQEYYNRETIPNADIPIREFTNADGRILEGDQISGAMSTVPHFADRSYVFSAVQDFEEANNLPEAERVIHDGSYEDKEFLYSGYDRYVGMSHRNDLSIQPYMERLENLKATSQESSSLPLIAEVYYAQQNGLTNVQISYLLDAVKDEKYPSWLLRDLRRGMERGLTEEQVNQIIGEDASVRDLFLGYMLNGATKEDIDALKGCDVAGYYILSPHLRDKSMNHEAAKAIIENVRLMKEWNRNDYDSQKKINPEYRPRFGYMDTEFLTEYLKDAAINDKSLSYETILAIGKKFLDQKDTNNIREFIESRGEVHEFNPHSEEEKMPKKNYSKPIAEILNEENAEKKAEFLESENQQKTEKEVEESIHQSEEKKDAKEQLNEQLQQGIREVLNSENFKNWLDTSSKMFINNYSFRNAILVWMQKPDAAHTMGYEQWKDYGRNVAQGAKGIKIFIPVIAYEKKDGDLWRMIRSNLKSQMKNDPTQEQVTYRVGMTKLEITMNQNGLYGMRIDGKEHGIHTEKDMQNFIKNNIIGKVPMYFTVGTVFDEKDTIVPEYLWVKKGFTKNEMVRDEKGKAIKNRKGEYKIVNTPERQAKFKPTLDFSVPQKDPEKMAILYDALKAVSERNGIHVYEKNREEDETLKGGADGYYSREFDNSNPKGFIVMPTDLEPTRAVTVMLHEMSHSELHGNLEKLAEKMGEDNIPRNMREIQAEAVAYVVGKNLGIETDMSSFQYLAAWSKGFELQALSKSIEVIYHECRQLTNELKTELSVRGLNMDLSEKEQTMLNKEEIETLSKSYAAYVVEQDNRIMDITKEQESLAEQNSDRPKVLSVIVEQSINIKRQEEDVIEIKAAIEELEGADTLDKQKAVIARIDAAKIRIEDYKQDFDGLSKQFQELTQKMQGLKDRYVADPIATLTSMKQEYPKLEQLSGAQMQYLAKSDYVTKELSSYLRNDPQTFVDKACERASKIDQIVSKNGMFVEITSCERWTDKPIVNKGVIMHPKVADTIIKQAEIQIRGLKVAADNMGEYFPYSKCQLMIYQAKNGEITKTFKTCVDIGDGAQVSLTDHIKQVSNSKDFTTDFEKATREKGAKEKILFNGEQIQKETPLSERSMSCEEWNQEIGMIKETEGKVEKNQQEQEKTLDQNEKNSKEK